MRTRRCYLNIVIAVLENLVGSSKEAETYGTVSPELLDETKDEDFDIMEYDGYLSLNRTVMYKESGVTVSVSEDSLQNYDYGFRVIYEIFDTLIAGDWESYNLLVSEKLQKKSFTQQQIYAVVITKYSFGDVSDKNGVYSEYVYKVEYKIHENNGSFRNDIVSDASRPQYFVVNNSSGSYRLEKIVEVGYLK